MIKGARKLLEVLEKSLPILERFAEDNPQPYTFLGPDRDCLPDRLGIHALLPEVRAAIAASRGPNK